MQKTFRMTPQRRILLEELTKMPWHPTVDELYTAVRKRLPRISLGTVYRNLEILAKQGIIQQLETAGSQKRFDGTTKRHYHIRCLRCGRIEDVKIKEEPDPVSELTSSAGYKVKGFSLEFLGYCPRCQNQEKD